MTFVSLSAFAERVELVAFEACFVILAFDDVLRLVIGSEVSKLWGKRVTSVADGVGRTGFAVLLAIRWLDQVKTKAANFTSLRLGQLFTGFALPGQNDLRPRIVYEVFCDPILIKAINLKDQDPNLSRLFDDLKSVIRKS